jgi:hypothetical protein
MVFCFAEQAKTAFNNPGAFAWCHYVVKKGELKKVISVLWIRNYFFRIRSRIRLWEKFRILFRMRIRIQILTTFSTVFQIKHFVQNLPFSMLKAALFVV